MAVELSPFVSEYKGHLFAGVDEVGRGPLAGDVVTAAVILDPDKPIDGLNDSKKLTEKRREALFDIIKEQSISWCIARASVEEIDSINILQASLLAMARAVDGLSVPPEHVLVDGNKIPKWDYSAEAVVKGDSRVSAISAASILAKVTRDREMIALSDIYPEYGFESHKGYPSKQHLEALALHGVLPIHRRSYAPVRKIIEQLAYS
ncbi:MAG: ribonuclease HII [Cellvibrionaceae bacterium]